MTKLNIDCLHLIFNELQKDINSLYSCLLVNKEHQEIFSGDI